MEIGFRFQEDLSMMVEQSYEHIETNYSLRKMVAEYFEEYQNALIDCDQKKEI